MSSGTCRNLQVATESPLVVYVRQMFGMCASVLLAIVGLLIFHVEPPKYAKPLDYRTDVLRS